jgi:predicted metal-binding membrane protein
VVLYAGVGFGVVDLVPTETAVARRESIIVSLALAFLTALAWRYLLWLSADMDMGGMDMSGFRMVPTGMGVMRSVHTPWPATEFALAVPQSTASASRQSGLLHNHQLFEHPKPR